MKPLKIYLDTSILGGYFDDEFATESKILIDQCIQGKFIILLSEVVLEELRLAPDEVKDKLMLLPQDKIEILKITPLVIELRNAYITAGVLGPKSVNDATHVALATIARADAIVSWNFKHIVNLDKIRKFNHINFANNYGLINIVSPLEVIYAENLE
jgi:predicted nucleic acid-binding protein